MGLLLAIFITMVHLQSIFSLSGNNVCEVQETYKINVTEFVPKNLTFRHYRWCLNMPPRCSYYTRKEVTEERVVVKQNQRTEQMCCPGYVEDNNTCVLDCTECRTKFCTNTTSNSSPCLKNVSSSQRCSSNSSCHGNCTSFEASCQEICKCPLNPNGERCTTSCTIDPLLPEIHTDLNQSTISIIDFSMLTPSVNNEATTPSVFQSIIKETASNVETVSNNHATTLSNQRGHLGNVSQLPVHILYEGLHPNSTVPLTKKKKMTMMDDESGKKRVVSTSAEAGPMTLHVLDKKTKEEQGSIDGTLDTDSEPVTVTQEAAEVRRHAKAKAKNDMEVSGTGATTTTAAEEEKEGEQLRRNVVGGGLQSLPMDYVNNGNNRVLFYVLLTLTGIGMTISAIVAAVFIIKFKYGRRNNVRDSSACCNVHFTKTDNNNSCSVAVNADCTNVNNVFQGVVSPDLLQHQGTLSKGLAFSTVPELVDFSVKFSSNVYEKYSSSENVYDEIPSCKEDPTFSSFYVNFNRGSNNT